MKKKLLFAAMLVIAFMSPVVSQQLVINEVVSSNANLNQDEDASYQDWIELYNVGSTPVNLLGYGLTDDSTNLFKWVFPAVTMNPGDYLLVWASDKNRTDPSNPLHANFKISASGEVISLTNPLSVVVDTAPATALLANESVGRIPNGTGSFVVIQTPTPNAENTNGTPIQTLNEPIFSQNSGFFTTGFTLDISTTEPAATIIYTLDGSEPDENNLLGTTYNYKNQYPKFPGQDFGPLLQQSFQTLEYSAPISIVDRSSDPNKISLISTTFDFLPPYFPNGPIFKGTIVRAKVIKPGFISSEVITKNYFISPQGNSLFTLPVLSLSIDENKLYDYNDGIAVAGVDFDTWRTANPTKIPTRQIGNYERRGIENERKANMQYFVNGQEKINQDVGIRVRGAYSRLYPSKSWNIYARSEFGDGNLSYKFFDDEPYVNFDRLSAKNSASDFYNTMFRDGLNHRLTSNLRMETEAFRNVIAFINGEYWGILGLREKYDDNYFKQVYNIDAVDMLENQGEIQEGDDVDYNNMYSYISNNSLATPANYSYIQTRMDTENFTDYFISNIFLQNKDWPGNNIVYWRKRTVGYEPNAPYGHDGRWRWALHDNDSTLDDADQNSLALATSTTGVSPNPPWSTLVLRKLLENETFKVDFITRFADLMNTNFLSSRIIDKIDEMSAIIAPEMSKQYYRWKAPQDNGDWQYHLNEEKEFANERPAYQREHIRNQFGIANDINTTIDVSNQNHGYVKVNTIEIKSPTPGIAANPYPWTGIYFADIPVKLKAIALPGYLFSHWTGFSTSTEEEITVTSNQSFSITAVFIPEGFALETSEPIYFWLMNSALPNDTPFTTINTTFQIANSGTLNFQSCLAGYPFDNTNPNWRKASLERRNSPTPINYIPEANNDIPYASAGMRAVQVKQPFQNNGLENELHFNFTTVDYKNIIFGFAAKDEGAAEAISISYSISEGNPVWITTGLATTSLPLDSSYQLFETDFSSILTANNNPNFKIRLQFTGSDMTVENGGRVTFNNFSVKGTLLPLRYPTPNVFTIGNEITALVPLTTAVADSYSISPALPNGLSIDSGTGIISGTPTVLSSASDYTVTATNFGGSTTFVLSIAVIDVVPSDLSYPTPNVFTINDAITDLEPTVSGGTITEFTISPALPSGLSFDSATGIISGTPTVLSEATNYTITAINSGGNTTFVVSIAVIDVVPSDLSYPTPNVFTINQAITDLEPTVSGGTIIEFTISPALPNGLSFDSATGIISGTPTVLSEATDYTITAINSGGNTTFVVSIAVIDVVPSDLSYPTPNVFTINLAITDLEPTASGGTITEFTFSPALPSGLSFDSSTGIISGTPTVLSSATNYTIIAINSGGNTTFVVSIAVIDVAPANLSYTTPNVFTISQAITDLEPTVSGGDIIEFTISPALPNGLSFDSATGIISGTPTVLSSASDYTVTAINSGGSMTFVVSIAVIDVAPTNLSYTTPNVFTINDAITNLEPTVSGGTITEFTISPALPNGLSFDSATGIISGTSTVLSEATDYTVTAINSGGNTTFVVSIAVIDVVPSDLSYPTPNVFTISQEITDLEPTVSGGDIIEFTISPALPNGLSFDSATGIISGTPTTLSEATDYTVTAINSGGNTTFVVSIAVIDVVPSDLSYPTPNVFTISQEITDLEPTVSGGTITEFTISPALSSGLSFDSATGIISGTPTVLSSATNYTITAINSGGNTTFVVSIAVIDVVPSDLSYPTPNVFTINQEITDLEPTDSGGTIIEFTISPALPNGLSFDSATGIISGTPTVLSEATNYTVTAINSGGSTSFTLSIAVIDVAPTNLSYTTPNVFTINQSIIDLEPTVSGGDIIEFTISPALPNGLSFDSATGIISGTPTVLSEATDYTITAINSGGNTTFVVSIAVIDVVPSDLSYPTPNVFTISQEITDLEPTVSGGTITEFTISQALPSGLIFDSATGIISGTPTVLSEATDYTITAINSGGNTTFVVSIAVIDVVPSDLSYPTPNVFTINQAITDLEPTVSGGTITEFTISPALPSGLSFDSATGIISGTPTVLSEATNYTITAINSGGNTTFVVSIAVIDVLPSDLSYPTPNVFTINQEITDLEPTVSGGTITEFTISPALLSGLSFDSATGIISGTSTALSEATDYTVTAINSGGNTTFVVSIAVIDVVPSDLSYPTPNVFTISQEITDLEPTVSGGDIIEFTISPALPNGLSLNSVTGIISGTPTVLSAATNYTVTATNSGGSTSFTLSIAIIDMAPASLSYPTPNVFTINDAINNLSPTTTGENLTFSISPSLPNGLIFSSVTGIISGTPTVLSSATNYTVTATNSGGSTTFVVSIAVIDMAPASLSYPTPNVFTINDAITDLSPTTTGENLTFTISPSLPNGLSLNSVTGIISGTPTVLSVATNYTVTATNSGGSMNFVLSIEVIEVMSIDEVKTPNFVLYPNPFENILNIKHSFDNVTYTLYSTDGKLIRKGILEASQILMPDLPSGMYLLQLESENSSQLFKIIKGIN